MAKVAFDPFEYEGKVQVEVEKIDNDKLENFENQIYSLLPFFYS